MKWIYKYIAFAALIIYAASVVIGELAIVKISGAASVVAIALVWLSSRSSLLQNRYEVILIPLYIIANVLLILSSDLTPSLKLIFSIGISAVLMIDLAMYYSSAARRDKALRLR